MNETDDIDLRPLSPADHEAVKALLDSEQGYRQGRACGCPECAPITAGEQASLWATAALGLSVVISPTLLGCVLFVVASFFTVALLMQGGR